MYEALSFSTGKNNVVSSDTYNLIHMHQQYEYAEGTARHSRGQDLTLSICVGLYHRYIIVSFCEPRVDGFDQKRSNLH